MKFPLLATLPLIAAVVISGCGGGGSETARINPKTIPDPAPVNQASNDQDNYGGYDQYGSDETMPLELLTIHFDYDRYDLNDEAIDALSANAQALLDHPGAVIRIEGHCDERGTEEYNMALGEKRAQTVRDYLLNYGIDPKHISVISYGELMPASNGHNESSWKKNRRAAFVVLSE